MPKRNASEALHDDLRHTKRAKDHNRPSDRLSALSHELILRVFSYLTVPDLAECQRLSHRLGSLSADSQIWKALYYNRFVRPRASKIPKIRDAGVPADALYFSSKLSRWLDDDGLVRRGKETNWKRQYKLRHNWSKGSCAVSEIPVAEEPSVPPILIQMHNRHVFLAEQYEGLRVLDTRDQRKVMATLSFDTVSGHDRTSPPSAMAIDTSTSQTTRRIKVVVGFQDGSFCVLDFVPETADFKLQYRHPPSTNGMLSAIALSSPYIATMTATQLLSFYKFTSLDDHQEHQATVPMEPPRLLHSLHSHTAWPPLSLCVRPSGDSVLVSVAYALPTYLSGWTVGIQELFLSTEDDQLISSRLTSAIDQQYQPLTFSSCPITPPRTPSLFTSVSSQSMSSDSRLEANQIHSKPTSLSYSHPYLLVTHPDNTLTLYLVSSTAESLSITPGSRLWGHTSSVSSAHVGARGKAVSVTSRGDELRVWELEGGLKSNALRRRLQAGELSVRIRPERRESLSGHSGQARSASSEVDRDEVISSAVAARGNGLGLALGHRQDGFDELDMVRNWIGFDEENVVVLKERSCGSQALVVYDFA